MASLKQETYVKTVERMSRGDFGWVVPWAIIPCKGYLYLNGRAMLHSNQVGTATVHVHASREGLIVDIIRCHGYKWEKRDDEKHRAKDSRLLIHQLITSELEAL